MVHEIAFTGVVMIAPRNEVTVKSRHPLGKGAPVLKLSETQKFTLAGTSPLLHAGLTFTGMTLKVLATIRSDLDTFKLCIFFTSD
jgi:hypothetical protein